MTATTPRGGNGFGDNDSSRYAHMTAVATIAIVAVLTALKAYAWIRTDSAAVMASMLDSFMDVGVSTMNLLVIRLSLKPADKDHRYGHGKAEGIAALFQSAFISGIAVFLLLESLSRFINPAPVAFDMTAVYIMALSMVMSVVIVQIQRFCLRRVHSLAVEADSAHYSSDIFVNLGTILILLALSAGAPAWVDPLFAVAVAVYLGFTVRDIGAKAIDMLMDHELPAEVRERIKEIVMSHPQALGLHDLRTRQIGMRWSISFDVEMEPDESFRHIHEYARQIEQSIVDDFPHAEVMIHMDPFGDRADSRHPEK